MQLHIRLNLEWPLVQAHLLQGLEQWVQLGLLTDAQVQEIAATLSEPLPPVIPESDTLDSARLLEPLSSSPQAEPTANQATPPASNPDREEPMVAAPAKAPNIITRLVQSFAAEISIVWFLFLGVFLVVVSSGVLAASQWQSFSATGQYAILLIYTLGFWGASLWAYRQARLQLTARMLTLTTLLIIPVNFWMMDSLGVLQSWQGIGIVGVASVLLTVICLKLISQSINRINIIGLSWLHWGWGITAISGTAMINWPLLATYIGTVGTTFCLISQPPDTSPDRAIERSNETSSSWAPDPRFETLTVALSLLVLLARSFWAVQIPLHQLGLALGLCGWVILKKNRQQGGQQPWSIGGWSLLLLGWGVTVGHQPPWQAIAVSGLALEHLRYKLSHHWHRGDLFKAIIIGFQAYWLLWFLLPMASRTAFLNTLGNFSTTPIGGEVWASVGLFPYVIGLLFLAKQLRRWQQPILAQQTEIVSLILGVVLALVSLSHSFTAAINLSLSAVTLAWFLKAQPRPSQALLELTHVTGLLAIVGWIHYFTPTLEGYIWGQVGLMIAIAEWTLSLILRSTVWQQSCWRMGLLAAGGAYLFLIDNTVLRTTTSPLSTGPAWWWLTTPAMLTLVANHRRSVSAQAAVGFSLIALLLQTPFLTTWPLAIVSFSIGTLCSVINSRVWRNELVALFAVGSGLAAMNCALWHWVIDNPDQGSWLVYGALQILGLWVLRAGLRPVLIRPQANNVGHLSPAQPHAVGPTHGQPAWPPLALLYRRALEAWGILLLVGLLLILTLLATVLYQQANLTDNPILLQSCGLATVITLSALGFKVWQSSADWQFWIGSWALALAAAFGVAMNSPVANNFAIALLILGMVTQFFGDFWTMKRDVPYRYSWHGIPLVYATLGALFSHGTFSNITGYYTLTAALIFIGIGRRRPYLSHFSYLGLLGLSWGAYELLVYRLWQASGGSPGDGITLLAGLALVIALGERLLGRWMLPYLQVRSQGLRTVAHIHWGLGSLLALTAIIEGLSHPTGIILWTIISLLLAGYGLLMGNHRWTPEIFIFNHEIWTWLGLGEAVLAIAYARFELFPDLTFLLTWGGLFACIIGYGCYIAPWSTWGWPTRPWQLIGLWLPILTISITLNQVKTQSLLFVGAFYAWMGKQFDQVRMSYLSVVLLDWALLRYLNQQDWLTALWFSTIVGGSILYMAEVDPHLKEISAKEKRHWLRSLACGLIGLTALYQVEVVEQWLIFVGLTLLLCLGFILAGLFLQVRAFLYVGTFTFVIQILRLLWLFVNTNAWMFWALGIVLGILFIWGAGTFEARRSQMTNLLESWTTALQTWD